MAKTANKHENGFTLIEILLISVIVSLVAVSTAMLFTGGRRTWTSADKGSETIQNAVIGMEKLVREIKNSPGLTYFSSSEIRFEVLRKDEGDLDGDGNTTEFITKYARTKRDGNYLKYGERDTDSSSNSDWTLNDLAYPVTNLSFAFKKIDGSIANPNTDDPSEIKSVLINMITSEDGVEIPLNSRAYLVMGIALHFDGTPDEGDDNHHYDEGDEDTDDPGTSGDNVDGWGLTDYVIYGDEAVNISNNCTIDGNVGTRNCISTDATGITYTGVAYESHNSTNIKGYLIVKGSLNMSNSSVVNEDSVLAACGTEASDDSYDSCSTVFDNNCQINGNFWTLKSATMSNSSWIHGTVYAKAEPTRNGPQADFDEFEDISADYSTGKHNFMVDPRDVGDDVVAFRDSVFPCMPSAEDFAPGTDDKIVGGNSTENLNPGYYDEIKISNSARLNLRSGDYFVNSIRIRNSARISFYFDKSSGNYSPIRIFVKGAVTIQNSASFQYYGEDETGDPVEIDDPTFGASLLYIEPQAGMTCENSVQWKGFIYSPNGSISFANGTTIYGAVYSRKTVNIDNHITATYVAPFYNNGIEPKLLADKFYSQSE